jgi:hypothetical protein
LAQNPIFGVNVVGRTPFQVTTFHVPSVPCVSACCATTVHDGRVHSLLDVTGRVKTAFTRAYIATCGHDARCVGQWGETQRTTHVMFKGAPVNHRTASPPVTRGKPRGPPGFARGYPPGTPGEQHPRNPQSGKIILIIFLIFENFQEMI